MRGNDAAADRKNGFQTVGGTNIVIGRDVTTEGGDFVAHDKVTVVNIQDVPVEIKDGYRESPSLDDIDRALSEQPPFQKEAIAKNYIDLKVSWHLKFFDVAQVTGSKYEITLWRSHGPGIVKTEVKIDEHPEFRRILKRNQDVHVKRGNISS